MFVQISLSHVNVTFLLNKNIPNECKEFNYFSESTNIAFLLLVIRKLY